ncbi:hypothetical protein D3C72_1774790 [compost metagenome]
MQHLEVGACAGQIRCAQNELRLHVGVFGRIQTLFLHPGHVENIQLGDHFFNAAVQAELDAFLFQHLQDIGRHCQRVRRDEEEAVAFKLGQRLRQ